jgi:hypothetical protein
MKARVFGDVVPSSLTAIFLKTPAGTFFGAEGKGTKTIPNVY